MMTEGSATFLNEAELAEIASAMERKHSAHLQQRRFEAKASKDATGVHAKITLKNKSGSFFYPVEARVAHLDHDMSPKDAAIFLLDYIDAYFAEYFKEGGQVYLPIDWAEFDFDGVPLQVKGQILNLEVEKMADELLAQADKPTLH